MKKGPCFFSPAARTLLRARQPHTCRAIVNAVSLTHRNAKGGSYSAYHLPATARDFGGVVAPCGRERRLIDVGWGRRLE